MTADVVIVGAGIVGAACAAELAARGLRVTVLDAQGIGDGATAAGMGHIVVMNDSPAEFALSRYSRDLWLALAPQLRTRDAFARCGTLWVAADAEELDAAREMHAAFAAQDVAAQLLDERALYDCEPSLAPGMAGGLLIGHDSIVYAPSAAQWLLTQSPGAARIDVRLHAQAVAVDAQHVTLSNGERVGGAHIVVANGLQARELVRGLPLQPKKGHLLITDRYPGFAQRQLVELGYLKSAHSISSDSVAFNVQPRKTGQVLIGSSRQYGPKGPKGEDDPKVEAAMLSRMLARACEYMPGVSRLSAIRAWTGFRAATPDKLPLIGPCPGHDRLYLATGHEGLGITTSMGTAKLLVDQLLNRRPAIPTAPYLPSRAYQEAAHA